MEPLYHTGDLVILQPVTRVEVGKIIAYNYPGLGRVIHRVVAIEGEHYLFKGDHNDWLDGYRPTQKDLIGEAWIHLPHLGRWVLYLKQPVNVAILMSLAGGILMFKSFFTNPRPKKRPKSPWRWPNFNTLGIDPATRETILFSLSLLLFIAIVLGLLSLTTPAYRTVSDDLPYTHAVTYSYTAPANPQVYDSNTVQPGEPLFPALNCTLDITIVYALTSPAPISLNGSYRTFVLVSEPNGWKRTYELIPETTFQNGVFGTQTRLDVCEIRKGIETMTRLTGLNRSVFDISIKTEIKQTGTIGERPYDESIVSSLDFGLDPIQLYLYRDTNGETDPLNWQMKGALQGSRKEVNTLSFLGLRLAVLPVRILSGIALVGALTGILILALPALTLGISMGEAEKYRLKYGNLIVRTLQPPAIPTGKQISTTVVVAGLDDLARIAQQTGTLIIEYQSDTLHEYTVWAENIRYTCTLKDKPSDQ